jgi:hypothetical protein
MSRSRCFSLPGRSFIINSPNLNEKASSPATSWSRQRMLTDQLPKPGSQGGGAVVMVTGLGRLPDKSHSGSCQIPGWLVSVVQ